MYSCVYFSGFWENSGRENRAQWEIAHYCRALGDLEIENMNGLVLEILSGKIKKNIYTFNIILLNYCKFCCAIFCFSFGCAILQ